MYKPPSLPMEFDSDWYAYQCKSGEVLFYYNTLTGEHRWAIHFCSCMKSNNPNAVSEPCCVWEPIKSQTSESGKFVRNIGTQTEGDHLQRDGESVLLQRSSFRSLTTETESTELQVAVLPTRGTEVERTLSNEKPVEVVLGDPFMRHSQETSALPAKHLTLKSYSNQEFGILEKEKKPSDKEIDEPANSLRSCEPVVFNSSGNGTNSVSSLAVLSHLTEDVRNQGIAKSPVDDRPSFCAGYLSQNKSENSDENKPDVSKGVTGVRRSTEGSSSRKNPEPRKLLKRTSTSTESMASEVDSEERYWAVEPKEKLFSETEEWATYQEEEIKETETAVDVMEELQEGLEDDRDSTVTLVTSLVCELCGKECTSATQLTHHLMKHQPSGTNCPLCHRYFSRRQGLRYHLQTHTGDKPHRCKMCSKTFTKSASLAAHLRTHSGERPFKCPQCNKGFTHSSNLSCHIRTHSNDRPYQCGDCDKGFKTSSHLSLHRRSHSDDRPYECSQCMKTFKNSSHLNSHLKLHEATNNFVCSKCNKGFKSFSHLSYHLQTHPHCSEEAEGIGQEEPSLPHVLQNLEETSLPHVLQNLEERS